jgi:hypothetical protein
MSIASGRNEVERGEPGVIAARRRSRRWRTAVRDWLYDGRAVFPGTPRLVIPSKVLREVRHAELMRVVR